MNPDTLLRLQTRGIEAHRLGSSPLVWLERFGPDLLLSYKVDAARDHVLGQLDTKLLEYGMVARRIFGKFLARAAEDRLAPKLLRGDAHLPLEVEVQEAGFNYGLDFAAGYSAGLFIDQRENRAHVTFLQPQRLLNTFAYTCSFSVVAAKAGAETLSLDLSRKSLTRGEENFIRNGLDPKHHRFIADDVFAVLPRLAKRGESFDAIILDPPTFSRNQKGQPFQVERNFGTLVELALSVASRQANILLSVNCTSLRTVDLEQQARRALKLLGRSGQFYHTPLPSDIPADQSPRTVWLELK